MENEVFDQLKYKIIIDASGNKLYYNNRDQLHREDGPAVEWDNGDRDWYLNGEYVTEYAKRSI